MLVYKALYGSSSEYSSGIAIYKYLNNYGQGS